MGTQVKNAKVASSAHDSSPANRFFWQVYDYACAMIQAGCLLVSKVQSKDGVF